MHSQEYRDGLKPWISNLKICIEKWRRIKEGTNDTKKFTGWLNRKRAWRGVLKIDACATTKYKIIRSWPNANISVRKKNWRCANFFYSIKLVIYTWKQGPWQNCIPNTWRRNTKLLLNYTVLLWGRIYSTFKRFHIHSKQFYDKGNSNNHFMHIMQV